MNRVHVVLSGFSMRLFCFVQAKTLCRYGGIYFLSARVKGVGRQQQHICKQYPSSPRLSTMNDETSKATWDHKRRQWREFVESIDHRTDSTKLWRKIKGIDGKSKQTA